MLSGAGLRGSHCSPFRIVGSELLEVKHDALSPEISPAKDLQPFLPLVAPSPLMPFTNNSVPALSGEKFVSLSTLLPSLGKIWMVDR